MEEHFKSVLLDNFEQSSDANLQHSSDKSHGVHSVLQNINERDQEFIDHSLLTPEYLTNLPNQFVIDMMQNQGNENHLQAPNYNGQNDTYSSELQFQNAIIQLVNNKHNLVRSTETQVLVTKDENGDKININSGFLPIDDGILTSDGQFRIFQPPVPQHSDHHNMSDHLSSTPMILTQIKRTTKQKLPIFTDDRSKMQYSNFGNLEASIKNDINHQGLLQINDETDNYSDQYFQHRSLSKRTLPHKKRITKKLKISNTSGTMIFQDGQDDCVDEDSIVISTNQFSCQLCEHMSDSQLEFFAHLKEHYEPSVDIISDKNEEQSSSEILMSDNTEFGNIMQKREKCSEPVADEQFEEVVIHFNNFQSSALYQATNEGKHELKSIKQEDMLMETQKINQKIATKDLSIQKSYTQEFEKNESMNEPFALQSSSDSNLQTKPISETEFSDTEDMLEGIRSVVDKVQESVDDTCDGMEMISNSSKTPWFRNNSLSSIYKEENTSNIISLEEEDSNEISKSQTRMLITRYSNNKSRSRYLKGVNDESSITSSSPKRGRPKGSGKKSKKLEPSDEDEESNENSKKTYFCEKCNKQFNSYNALKYHDLSHTGERPHQCTDCEKSFFAQSALKAHLRVHSGDKPYECDVCKRKFRQWGDLKYHTISIHSNEKNYQCEFCGKAFSRNYSLVIHRRIHTSEKNYKCEFCSKSFRASSYLQNHRKIHTGEKPYECKVCSKKFRVCGDLRRHQKTHERSKKRLAHINKNKLDKTDLLHSLNTLSN